MSKRDRRWGDTAMISREEMAGHIDTGRARRWTHELGPDRLVVTAASMDGIWYVVPDGADGYLPAPKQLAAVLTVAERALTIADEKIAEADSAARTTATQIAGPGAARSS